MCKSPDVPQAELIALQADVDAAERRFENLVANLTRELEQTRSDATATIQEALQVLNSAQEDSKDSIREVQEDLHRVCEDFERDLGNAT